MENVSQKIVSFFDAFKALFTTAFGALSLAVSIVFSSQNMQVVFSLFVVFLLVDYVTGIWASWVEYKRGERQIKVYLIESERLRASGIKVIGYCLVLILGWGITQIFYKDGITFMGAHTPLSPLEIATGICMCIEFLSNLENLKRMGFDLIGGIVGGSKKLWSVFNSVKNNKHD